MVTNSWRLYPKFFDKHGTASATIDSPECELENWGPRFKNGKARRPIIFPPQVNNQTVIFPYTFFGISSGNIAKKKPFWDCLKNFNKAIIKITKLFTKPSTSVRVQGWKCSSGECSMRRGHFVTYEASKSRRISLPCYSITGEWGNYSGWLLLECYSQRNRWGDRAFGGNDWLDSEVNPNSDG